MTSRYFKSPRPCAVALLVAVCFWLPSGAQEAPAPSEYQIKAVFLLNFLKYVEWPAAAHSTTNSPFKIVHAGEDRFAPDFAAFAKSKTVDHRAVVLKRSAASDDWQRCHILFVGASERRNARNILSTVKGRPVLTVSESDNFIAEGGMINFVMKDNKVRLHINLAAAEKAGLKISSRLLGIADVVKRE